MPKDQKERAPRGPKKTLADLIAEEDASIGYWKKKIAAAEERKSALVEKAKAEREALDRQIEAALSATPTSAS